MCVTYRRQIGHVTRIFETRNEYKILVEKLEHLL
jgi:hypothetical protein